MKRMTKAMVIGVLAIAFISFSTQKIKPAEERLYCYVFFQMENKDRHCYGYVNTECSWPRAPYGNWGVDSNLGSRFDDHQFQGWYPADGWMQWNSCYKDYPPPDISCNYYYNDYETAQGCWQQHTSGLWDPNKVWKEYNTYAWAYRRVGIPRSQWDYG